MSNDVSKTWVIGKKPFNPADLFVSSMDFTKENGVFVSYGLNKALKFWKAEVYFAMDVFKYYMNMSKFKPYNVTDHMFPDAEEIKEDDVCGQEES